MYYVITVYSVYGEINMMIMSRFCRCFVENQLSPARSTFHEQLPNDNLYEYLWAGHVITETLDGYTGGLWIWGRTVTNLRYADEIILIAISPSDLQESVDRLDRASRKYGLEINIDRQDKDHGNTRYHITINGTPVEKVETFTYLGSLFTQEVECDRH